MKAPSATLDAWDTFGPAVVLLLAAACAALALVVERAHRAQHRAAGRDRRVVRAARADRGDRRDRAGCSSGPTTPPRCAPARGWRSRAPSRSWSAPGSRCATNARRCTSRAHARAAAEALSAVAGSAARAPCIRAGLRATAGNLAITDAISGRGGWRRTGRIHTDSRGNHRNELRHQPSASLRSDHRHQRDRLLHLPVLLQVVRRAAPTSRRSAG